MTSNWLYSVKKAAAATTRHRWLIACCVAATVVSAWQSLACQPPMYECRAVLRVDPTASAQANASSNEVPKVVSSQIYSTLARSAARELEDVNSAHDAGNRMSETPQLRILPGTSLGLEPDTFVISLTGSDSALTESAASQLALRLVSDNNRDHPRMMTPEMQKRLAEADDEISSLESRYPWLRVSGAEGPSGPAIAVSQRNPHDSPERSNQNFQLESLRDKQFLIRQQLADIDERLIEQRRIVALQRKSPSLGDNATYAALVARRTELQGQRDTLINRRELTDKHPRVTALDDQINAINRQLDELRTQQSSAVTQTAEARELASLETIRKRLALELEIGDREIARITPVVARETARPLRTSKGPDPRSRIMAAYDAAKKRRSDVAAQTESERPATESRFAPEKYSLVTETPSMRVVSSLSPAALSVAAIFGLGAGMMLSFLMEASKFATVTSIRDVEVYGRMTLIGVVPTTLTAAGKRNARLMRLTRIAGGAAATLAVAVVLTKILISTRVLEYITSN